MKLEGNKIISAQLLSADIANKILQKQHELVRGNNISRIDLFWMIGQELKQHFDKDKKAFDLIIVANKLTEIYGNFFTNVSLENMIAFVKWFPNNMDVSYISSIGSWEHIQLLMGVEDPEARSYYTQLTAQEGLSITDLQLKISSDYFDKAMKEKKTNASTSVSKRKSIAMSKISNMATRRLFDDKNALKHLFPEWTEPNMKSLFDNSHVAFDEIDKTWPDVAGEEAIILEKTYSLIALHRCRGNDNFNTSITRLLWEIGNILIASEAATGPADNDIYEHTSKYLEQDHGIHISAGELIQMTGFAMQITDKSVASQICDRLEWAYIVELLPLRDVEAWLYYTRLIVIDKLTLPALRKLVLEGTHEQSEEAKLMGKKIMQKIKTPVLETIETETKGNNTTTVKKIFIDVREELPPIVVQKSFYNHPYFPLFAFYN